MNFTAAYDYLLEGQEWRGVVTRDACYARWLDGRVELHDLERDPLQMTNLAGDAAHASEVRDLERRLQQFMRQRGDRLAPCTELANWYDEQRRVVRNGYGPLRHPETAPDWSLLGR